MHARGETRTLIAPRRRSFVRRAPNVRHNRAKILKRAELASVLTKLQGTVRTLRKLREGRDLGLREARP